MDGGYLVDSNQPGPEVLKKWGQTEMQVKQSLEVSMVGATQFFEKEWECGWTYW